MITLSSLRTNKLKNVRRRDVPPHARSVSGDARMRYPITNQLKLYGCAALLALSCNSASGQQITGVPGSPEATTTITGKQLPPPSPKFGGVIKEEAMPRYRITITGRDRG